MIEKNYASSPNTKIMQPLQSPCKKYTTSFFFKSRNLFKKKNIQPLRKKSTQPLHQKITQPLHEKIMQPPKKNYTNHATSPHKKLCNPLTHSVEFLAALSSSGSLVVGWSVGRSVGPSVYLCENVTFRLS